MNDQKFSEVKQHYDQFYKSLLQEGQLPLGSTAKGFWGHMPTQDIYEAFKKLNLRKYSNFIDLGSGDGKVVLLAALFCKHATGIEIDNKLFQKSLQHQRALNIPNATFMNTDFYDLHLHPYDAVFVYPDQPFHRGLDTKCNKELSGKLIHSGHHFHPETLKKRSQIMINGNLFTVYSK